MESEKRSRASLILLGILGLFGFDTYFGPQIVLSIVSGILGSVSGIIGSIILVIIVGVVAYTLFSSFVRIRPNERALVERFGEYHKFLEPGLHFLLPHADTVYRRDTTEQMKNVAPSDMITKDNLNANVDLDVYYRVKPNEDDVKRSFYEVDDYERQITRLAQTTARDIIGRKRFETVNSDRSELNRELYEELEGETDKWGIEVVRVEMKEITPPSDVQDSMNEILKAENEKEAASDRAEARRIEAEGKKKAAIEKAKGERRAAVLESKGKAEAVRQKARAEKDRIKLVNTALREHFKNEAQEYKKLETTQKSLKNGSKYIIGTDKNITTVLSEAGDITPIPEQTKWKEPEISSDELDIGEDMEKVTSEMEEKINEAQEKINEAQEGLETEDSK